MEQNDQRNLMLALVLCFGLFMIYNFLVLDPQQKARQAALDQAQQNAVTQSTAPAPTIRLREEVVAGGLAAGARVALDAPAIEGSISLLGARIDDVQLKGFYDTIDDKEAKNPAGEIKLMAPEGTERAFYATVAWTTPTTSTDSVVWTQTSTGPLTTTNPLGLSYVTPVVKIDGRVIGSGRPSVEAAAIASDS